MDDWRKFNETLPEKEEFYSHLGMEDITDVDYTHANILWLNTMICMLKIIHYC